MIKVEINSRQYTLTVDEYLKAMIRADKHTVINIIDVISVKERN